MTQAKFSAVDLPYSLKLLWAPMVDAAYSRRIGKRKSWLIPVEISIGKWKNDCITQYLYGFSLKSLSYVNVAWHRAVVLLHWIEYQWLVGGRHASHDYVDVRFLFRELFGRHSGHYSRRMGADPVETVIQH